jgi:hypothetical protein
VAGQEVACLVVGALRISFQRSLKLAANAPASRVRSFGALPVAAEADGMALVPVAEDESVWIGLDTTGARPSALRLRIAGVESDPVSGLPVAGSFEDVPQNYVVVPSQHWIAGATVQNGCARQFVRCADAPHHLAVTAFQFFVAGLRDAGQRTPDRSGDGVRRAVGRPGRSGEGQGRVDCRLPGHIQQTISGDPYGLAAWNLSKVLQAGARLVSGDEYARATGLAAPAPIDPASSYRGWRLP